eukprot:6210926-Pleurochrysis_carterae.AAC.1
MHAFALAVRISWKQSYTRCHWGRVVSQVEVDTEVWNARTTASLRHESTIGIGPEWKLFEKVGLSSKCKTTDNTNHYITYWRRLAASLRQ